jgi:hypothetical protein
MVATVFGSRVVAGAVLACESVAVSRLGAVIATPATVLVPRVPRGVRSLVTGLFPCLSSIDEQTRSS